MTTKPNKTRSLAALVLLCAFALYIAIGTLTFSRFIESYRGSDQAEVAQGVTHYRREKLLLNGEAVSMGSGDSIQIDSVAPTDEIDYTFSVSDRNGAEWNEVYLQVTVTFSIRIEILPEDADGSIGKMETYYFPAGGSDDGELQGAAFSLYVLGDISDGTRTQYSISPDSTLTGTDFLKNPNDLTNKALCTVTETVEEDGTQITVYEHKTGLYLAPAEEENAQEYTFRLDITLPQQVGPAEEYVADARVVLDLHIDAEQVQTQP